MDWLVIFFTMCEMGEFPSFFFFFLCIVDFVILYNQSMFPH